MEIQATRGEPRGGGDEPADPLLGQRIDRYRVVEKLGEGGMGAVYAVEHVLLHRRMAMKVLRAALADSEEFAGRFHNEAIAASRIRHPHVVDVVDFGWLDDGRPFLVMEELRGTSLDAVLRQERIPLPRALRIADQVSQALAAAHAAGVVHRDLKPVNVLLVGKGDLEAVKVLDFGISKVSASHVHLTQLGRVLGTPEYMSPEQTTGEALDGRSDIYSLGILLFELVTGRPPFVDGNLVKVMLRQRSERPAALRSLRPDLAIPAELEALVGRMLAKSPGARPQTMEACVAALRRLQLLLPPPFVAKGAVSSRPGDGVRPATPAPAACSPSSAGTEARWQAALREAERRERGGELAGAVEALKQALPLAPGTLESAALKQHIRKLDDELAARDFAEGRREDARGNHSAAARAYERALARNPRSAAYLEAAARKRLYQGTDLAAAVRLAELAAGLHPGDGEVRTTLARAYLEAGRSEDARRELDVALRLAPEHAFARRLRHRLHGR